MPATMLYPMASKIVPNMINKNATRKGTGKSFMTLNISSSNFCMKSQGSPFPVSFILACSHLSKLLKISWTIIIVMPSEIRIIPTPKVARPKASPRVGARENIIMQITIASGDLRICWASSFLNLMHEWFYPLRFDVFRGTPAPIHLYDIDLERKGQNGEEGIKVKE